MDFLVNFVDKFRHIINKRHFFIVIRDEYTSIVHMNRSTFYQRSFDNSEKDLSEAAALLNKNKNSPVHIVLDHTDTSLSLHPIPQLGISGTRELAARTLKKKYGDYELKNYMLLGKSTEKTRHLDCCFAAAKSNNNIDLWINMIVATPNNIAGFLLAPLELRNLYRYVHKNTKTENKKTLTQWSIIVMSTRLGGMRQLVLKEGNTVFTRLIAATDGLQPEELADSLYNDVQSTIQYISRFGYTKNTCEIKIHTVAEAELNKILQAKYGNKIHCMTTDEVIGLINPKHKESSLVSADAILCNILYKHGASLSLRYIKIMHLINLYTTKTVITLLSRTLAGIGAVLIIQCLIYIHFLKEESLSLEMELVEYKQIKKTAEDTNGYTLSSINAMKIMVNEHNYLIHKSLRLTDYLNKLRELRSDNVIIKSISIDQIDPSSIEGGRSIRATLRNAGASTNSTGTGIQEIIKMNATLSSERNDDINIFTKHTMLAEQLQELFPSAIIKVSDISGSIDLESSQSIESLEITIINNKPVGQ